MNPVLCDTNVFISVFRDFPEAIQSLENIGEENIFISSVSVMELYRGMGIKRELNSINKKIKEYNILHFNENVSSKAVELMFDFRLSHNLDIPDAIIAVMALSYDLPLFTYNVKDFKFIPKLKLHSPS